VSTLIASARAGAQAIRSSYQIGRRAHQEITRGARVRFEQRDWAGGQQDAGMRLELYRLAVEGVLEDLARILGPNFREPAAWHTMREFYTEAIEDDPSLELAETFFNSITRKVFATVGVNDTVEYVDLDARRDHYGHPSSVHESFARTSTVRELVERLFAVPRFSAPYCDPERDIDLVADAIEDAWCTANQSDELETIDLVKPVLYRGTAAYLIGRMRGGHATEPLVIVMVHGDDGIEADAVLSTEREVSILFSYTRSHFLVDVARPVDLVEFLATLMPRKPIPELYISLGFPKHGKTEMYRDLMGNLSRSMDRFTYARGEAGMVMIVFAKPSYDYVFKIIRDSFAPPKTGTREGVIDRYHLVSRHDRAGRMIEAQEFENLVFNSWRFSPELLEELRTGASETVTIEDSKVRIKHVYIERRVDPLNLFLREASEADADQAVRDYGQAIRDLATTNIFPGDLLLKNFGVTRNGRVTFYDYDELSLVTE